MGQDCKFGNELERRESERLREKILAWIDTYQSGKSGIYPHSVALEVCAEFGITLPEARGLVLEHIKHVMAEGLDEHDAA